MMRTMLRPGPQSLLTSLILCLPSAALFAQKKPEPKPQPAQSIPELRQQLEKILNDTHTPGVSVAIVRRDGPEWVDGVGKANVAAKPARHCRHPLPHRLHIQGLRLVIHPQARR